LRCRSLLWLRRHRTSGSRLLLRTPARPAADFPGSDRCGFARLDRWRTSDSHRLFRASDRPMAIHPACAERPLHRQGRRSTADSHQILILQLGWLNNPRLSPVVVAASGLRLSLPQPPAFTGCCPHFSPNRRRTSDSHRLFHPPASPVSIHATCAARFYLRLGL